jgi:NAD(P)-dependent dehydrogenase (short-subunit alcohol dehydrogenase family)
MVPAEFLNELRSRSKIEPILIREPLNENVGRSNSMSSEDIPGSPGLHILWIEPEAIAPVVVFLASDDARMVSGATYDATGGDSANYSA